MSKILLLASLFLCTSAGARGLPFRKTDKGPYGTYVLYDQLPSLFPGSSITINHNSAATKLKYNFQNRLGYFVIAPYVSFPKQDREAFETFLQRGNVLMISTYYMDEETADWLDIDLGISFAGSRDSIRIFDMDKSDFTTFSSGKFFQSYITRYDSTASDIQQLGKYNDGSLNFICFKKFGGYIVVHTQPYMFSNYHLIKKKTKAYSEIFFSSLPGPLDDIIWDEHAKSSSGEFAPLNFVMSQPPLRNAFWWALAGLLLVMFISFKRRQRIIPVISPLKNNSLDMVRTVSDMYYYSHRNNVMARKKIAHWLEFLRVKYNISNIHMPDIFWQSVKMRSDLPDEKMALLRRMVETHRTGYASVDNLELITLNKLIDTFYTS